MEYIHALKKRAVKSDNEIVKLNKVIKEKDIDMKILIGIGAYMSKVS